MIIAPPQVARKLSKTAPTAPAIQTVGREISAEVTVQPSLSAEVLCLVRSHRTVRTLCLLAPGEWVGLGSRRRPQKDASYFAGQSGLPGRLRW